MVKIISCDNSGFVGVGKAGLEGATIVFPTDTVYGLGTSPTSEEGVTRCFELKKREEKKAMPILFSRIEVLERFVELDSRARRLAETFWPGPLTLVLPLKQNINVPAKLIGPHRSLAVRIPNHKCCKSLIESCGGSLVGTSANISGKKPSRSSEDPDLIDFSQRVDYFVVGVCGSAGRPSTVMDLTASDEVVFVREGAISKSEIISHLEKTSKTDFSSSKPGI